MHLPWSRLRLLLAVILSYDARTFLTVKNRAAVQSPLILLYLKNKFPSIRVWPVIMNLQNIYTEQDTSAILKKQGQQRGLDSFMNWMMRFFNWWTRFMSGRYGMDQLGVATIVIYLRVVPQSDFAADRACFSGAFCVSVVFQKNRQPLSGKSGVLKNLAASLGLAPSSGADLSGTPHL